MGLVHCGICELDQFHFNTLEPEQMASILQTTFSNVILVEENFLVFSFDFCLGPINTLRPRQNGRDFAENIFMKENLQISIEIH